MRKLLKSYKTEINPTLEQKQKINQTIGVCRFIYNFYLAHNKEIYDKEKRFVSGYEFSKWLNNEFISNNSDYKWIKGVSSKAVKQSIMNGEKAFKRFFKGISKLPKFKKKRNENIKAYFPKNSKTDWTIERYRVKIPTLGFVRLKEFGYIPKDANVKSGTVSYKAGRYYVSVLVEENIKTQKNNINHGMGIDLGIKDFAICSTLEKPFKNINKAPKIKKIEQKLKKEQRKLSRKYKNIKKKGGETVTQRNISKQVLKIQRIYNRLTNIRTDYINKVVNEIVKTKPSYITIEDLNIKGMMKNRHLSKAIIQQKFYEFRTKLNYKCRVNEIEFRIADRFYPSSKMCSECGAIKKDLKLSDRTYICKECGCIIDRDLNAAINLQNTNKYKLN